MWTRNLRAGGKQLHARLLSLDGQRVSLSDAEQAAAAKARVEQGGFVIRSVKRGEKRKHPAPPFTTSNLQQEASRKLGFTTAKTMQIAQQLYEGVDIEGRGTLGLDFLHSYRQRAPERRGGRRRARGDRGALRRGIRAGKAERLQGPPERAGRARGHPPGEHRSAPGGDQGFADARTSINLYKLVYLRFVACQMADAVYETQQIEIASESGAVLRSSAERLKFAGFTAVYEESTDDAPAQDEEQSQPDGGRERGRQGGTAGR